MEARFVHLVTKDEDLLAHMMEWKLSFLNCKKYWDRFAEKHGVKRYVGVEFDSPKFYFPREFRIQPGWSNPTAVGWCRPNSVRLKEEVNSLPKPESFAKVCVGQLKLPDIPQVSHELPYKLMWTRRNRLIVRMLDLQWLEEVTGQRFSYPQELFRAVSNERVQYWFALDQLRYRGEEPD